ncbi:MAG: His-Xaa-Ser system protein HxsD [Verrucomicrobiae bacterium]|nr:His-Xaa-Ser system protein HxsD [Verrucomicrobiae bacterium]
MTQTIEVDLRCYSIVAIQEALYGLSGEKTSGIVEKVGADLAHVLLESGERDIKERFWNLLNDHQLRFTLAEETVAIREAIIKQAFAPLESC